MKFTMGIVASLVLFAASASHAKEDCIAQKDMQQIAMKFTQFKDMAGAEYCYDNSQTSNLLQAIMFMRSTGFAGEMPKSKDELFSGTFANDWWGYFTGRIDFFDVQAECPKGVGAYVYGFGSSMYVCPMLLTDNFTALDRASVFMHEARHMDGFPHITCDRGPRAGLGGACDQRMSDEGSYSVTVETYAQLARYAPDLHPALRAYARSAAVIYADEAFETPVKVDREDKFLLLTNTKEFYRMGTDGTDKLERLGDAPTLGHIVIRARHMILFPEDKTMDAKYVFANNQGEIHQQAGDLAMEYNAQTPAERAKLVDMYIGAQWSTRVFTDHLKFLCDPRSSDSQDVSLDRQVPVAVIYPDGLDRGAASRNLLTESGAILQFGCQSGRGYVKASALTLDQKFKRVYASGKLVLGLSPAGNLFRIDGMKSTPLSTSVDGRIFDLVPTQAYSFFDGE